MNIEYNEIQLRNFIGARTMTKGLEIRAQIDSENVKGLLLINGGGAVALLAFLPTVIDKPDFKVLTYAILAGLFVFQLGLLSAVLHNSLRRQCSLEYERYNYNPPKRPGVCRASTFFLWSSVVAFLMGGLIVLTGAVCVL